MHLVFERGSFTKADTVSTATALLCYTVGLLGLCRCVSSSPRFVPYGMRGRRRSLRGLRSGRIFCCPCSC
ncbi:MAG: hypothetical protein IPO99_20335 [Nitrospira sp.]|nr:hypothetical protein [Nitrospira sp.]